MTQAAHNPGFHLGLESPKDLQNRLARAAPDEALDAIVKKIKRIDRIAMLMDTTNVNPRIGMDVIFLESMGK